jgi:hypothetical protein
MKVQCVTYSGLIRMIDVVGVSVQEVRDTLSDKIYQRHSVSWPVPYKDHEADKA